MSDQLESFQMWARAQIVSSISWPVSFVTVSGLTAFIDLSEPSLPVLWLLGLVMGGITALSSGLVVKRQISRPWKWAIVNFLGIPFSLTVAYLVFPFLMSPTGFAAAGICTGLITSIAQSLALERQHSKIVPLISGTFSWALAFLFGYFLMVQEAPGTFAFIPSDFFTVMLLGWGVAGPFLLILLLGFSPISSERASAGAGVRFN